MQKVQKILAIDGPGGSGKSSVAKLVADKLSALYVDTGSLYRAIGYHIKSLGLDFSDELAIQNVLSKMKIEYSKSADCLVEVNGENLTEVIREHEVSYLASEISKIPIVREFLLSVQRNLVSKRFCVMEGRDIGTVIFPDAYCKIYLTASIEVRAKRRFDQLLKQNNKELSLATVLEDVKVRDEKDMNRKIAPLKQAEDAILVDTSELTEEETINSICEHALSRAKSLGISLCD